MSIARHLKKAGLALLTVSSIAGVQGAFADGTASNTTISNRATVSYSVGGVAQAPIGSSPTGNSSGAGADTTFVVDNKVMHFVSESGGAANTAIPGGTNVLTFIVRNQGNTAQGYLLTATDTTSSPAYSPPADSADLSNYRVRVEAGAVPGGDPNAYDPTDTAENILSLDPDTEVRVYVLADVPAGTPNGARANVQLAAQATTAGTTTVVLQSTGADDPNAVDVVFADAGTTARDGIHEAVDQYLVSSASLTVTKTSTVIRDPFNNTSNPKAIPGAVVEYTITVANTGGADATGVVINDPLPVATTFLQGEYAGATDVELQVGAGSSTHCVAETAASSADGCYRDGGALVVGAPSAMGTVPAGETVTLRFRVEIN